MIWTDSPATLDVNEPEITFSSSLSGFSIAYAFPTLKKNCQLAYRNSVTEFWKFPESSHSWESGSCCSRCSWSCSRCFCGTYLFTILFLIFILFSLTLNLRIPIFISFTSRDCSLAPQNVKMIIRIRSSATTAKIARYLKIFIFSSYWDSGCSKINYLNSNQNFSINSLAFSFHPISKDHPP